MPVKIQGEPSLLLEIKDFLLKADRKHIAILIHPRIFLAVLGSAW